MCQGDCNVVEIFDATNDFLLNNNFPFASRCRIVRISQILLNRTLSITGIIALTRCFSRSTLEVWMRGVGNRPSSARVFSVFISAKDERTDQQLSAW
jgi:hypothetical protein